MWVQPALDPDLGLIYVNTGNPWPDYNGSTRAGDNLFTCSIVALDAMTGKYRWHFQAVHHDLWDFDMPSLVILFDQVYGGQTRKALAAHSKQGWVYILDRVSGKPLIPVDEKPVLQDFRQKTAATQPIPQGDPTAPQCASLCPAARSGCMFTPVWTDTKIAQPSAAGDWAPGAYDPQTGYLFFTTGVSTRQFSPTGRVRPGHTRVRLDNRARFPDQQTGVAERGPVSRRLRQRCSATGGGLIFHGGSDGFFRAFDSKTARAWRASDRFRSGRPGSDVGIGRRTVRRHCCRRQPRRD